MPSPDSLAPEFWYPDMALIYAKCPLPDIIKAANNGVQFTKKQGCLFSTKSDNHASSLNANPSLYNPRSLQKYLFQYVVLSN